VRNLSSEGAFCFSDLLALLESRDQKIAALEAEIGRLKAIQ
jgi:uncharacterized small protein (DUF1192 family)